MEISQFITLEDLSASLREKVLRTQEAMSAAGVKSPSVGQALAVVLAQREESPGRTRKKRTKYEAATKEEAVRRLEAGEPAKRIAAELGITNLASLYQWKSAAAKAKAKSSAEPTTGED